MKFISLATALPKLTAFLILLSGMASAQNLPNSGSTYPTGTAYSFSPMPFVSGVKMNLIRTTVPLVALQKEVDIVPTNYNQSKLSTQYLDGLGRLIQKVDHFANPTAKDVVTSTLYDVFGREGLNFLPYAKAETTAAAGKFKLTGNTDQKNFYKGFYSQDNYFYSFISYESSPLNRVIKTMSPGNSWVGNSRGMGVSENPLPAGANIRIFTIAYAPGSLPTSTGVYNTGELMVKITTDEDGNFTEEYTNKESQLILKATGKNGNAVKLQTYYVYDELGLLRYVIPPKATVWLSTSSWTMNTVIATNLCFSYEYDYRLRPIVKTTPGGGAEWMVYNQKDQLVFSQTPLQRERLEWAFIKYDVLGRTIQTGIYVSSSDRESLQNTVNNPYLGTNDLLIYLFTDIYGNAYSYSFRGGKVYSSNYYDDYSFTTRTYNGSYMGSLPAGWNNTVSQETTNLLTGTKTVVMDGASTATELITVNFYNDRALLIQSQSQNHKGSWNTVTNSYDFSNQKLGTFTELNNPLATDNALIKTIETFTYDHGGRLRTATHKLNDLPVQTNVVNYDEIGRVANKIFSNAGSPSVEYEYNVRNWVTGINKNYCLNNTAGPSFGMELNYDYGYTTNYFNGRIAGMKWRNVGKGTELRSYGYTYDDYNRLKSGDFVLKTGTIASTNPWANTTKDYTASNMLYDENGNLKSMKQMGLNLAGQKIVLDDLTYSYSSNSNRLLKIDESSSSQSKIPTVYDELGDFRDVVSSVDYTYDVNGNVLTDANKSIAFNYDEVIGKTNRITKGTQNVDYLYDAGGNKLQKKVSGGSTTTTTDYIGGAIYINNALSSINHSEGRIRYNGTATNKYMYDFYIRDHLGSTRSIVTYTDGSITGFAKADNAEENVTTYIATSETDNASKENQLFDNIDNTRAANPDKKTPTDNYVARISSKNSKTILGPDITLKVTAGDVVKISAEALYIAEAGNPNEVVKNAINNFVTAFTTPVSVAAEGINTIANSNMKELATSILNIQKGNTDKAQPKAFLNYILYDQYMHLIVEGSGALQVKNKAGWQTLETDKIEIPQNGFLRVFSNNMETTPVNINNTAVAVSPGKLVEEYNYYPYGLAFDQTLQTSTTIPKTNYLYNGKELQHNEFGAGNGIELEDYGARLYDPQIGRWIAVDPLARKYNSLTPYNYCRSNPINTIDFDGRDIIVLNAPKGAGGAGHAAALIGNDKTGWFLYSKNGTYPFRSSGPSNSRELAIPYKDLADFKERYLNTEKNIDAKTGGAYYTNGYRITTDPDADAEMEDAAQEQTLKWYDASGTVSGNCMDVCKDALSRVGLDPGTTKEKPKTGGSRALLIANTIKNTTPNEIYKNIVKNNKGTDISKTLVPDKKATKRELVTKKK